MADESNNEQNKNESQKVEFTPEQQSHIQTLIDGRFAKVKEKHDNELKTIKEEKERVERELEEARKAKPNSNKSENDNHEESPEQKQFKELLDNEKNKSKLAEQKATQSANEAAQARAEVLASKKTQAMINAAQKQNFYEIETALKLNEDKIEWDADSKSFVVKENGIIKQNNSLQNMSLEEYFATFASQRPYLVSSEGRGGSGSHESSGSTSTGLVKTKQDLKTAKDKSDWIIKNGFERYEALPLK